MTGVHRTSRGSIDRHGEEPEAPCVSTEVYAGLGSIAERTQSEPFDGCEVGQAMRAVWAFHAAFGLPRQLSPGVEVSAELAQLRVDLLEEEVAEFADATKRGDITALADALGDIVYVAYGAAVTYGIDLDAVLAEIHQSNMSKLDTGGRPVLRDDGKVLKSSRYRAPDVARVLAEQPNLPFDEEPSSEHDR